MKLLPVHACSVLAALLAPLAAGISAKAQFSTSPSEKQRSVQWVTLAVNSPRVSSHTLDSVAAKGKVRYHLYAAAA